MLFVCWFIEMRDLGTHGARVANWLVVPVAPGDLDGQRVTSRAVFRRDGSREVVRPSPGERAWRDVAVLGKNGHC
jgi:hypothetical protein